jgi:hypothetical protein
MSDVDQTRKNRFEYVKCKFHVSYELSSPLYSKKQFSKNRTTLLKKSFIENDFQFNTQTHKP